MEKEPIKILLVTHYYPEHRGGVEIFAGKLAEQLINSKKVKIQWMASNVDPHPQGITELTCLPMSATNWIENKILIPYPIWSISSLYKLGKIIGSVNVIHLHDYLYMSNIAAFIFAKIHRKPIVITQHIGFVPYNNPLFRGLLAFLNQTLGCFILRNADQTVFYSEVVQQYFSSKTRFKHPPLMIPNGVETNLFFTVSEEKRKSLRQDLKFPLDKIIFLFVGRFVEKKGLPILQQLAKRFSFIDWVFAGWGTLDPSLWELPNVKVFRDRKGATLAPLYQTADLLILPSKGEGFPLVIQESMACGTPVMVGSETSDAYSAVKHLMFSERVDTADVVERWSAKIEQLLQTPSTLTNLRTEVTTFAQQHWSWEICTEKYFQIFQKLAQHQKS